jgi:hypothetical protein
VVNIVTHFNREFVTDGNEGEQSWNSCSVVVGLHPDEATEDIVDLALEYAKPFAVVPCCVFWKTNVHRRVEGASGKEETVKTWDQFVDYLASKHPPIRRHNLPMEGRGVVLYYFPH